ncbi:hypothetical protein O181_073727 [Austropuccinia psidii MF-1]|uniref:Uncharacterized protein n=1 Tax=Austropuccinia psidii MF-1 TaxID=1389203 RepID=A0A9Q3IBB5_9BASI|nr:hypothetical protein [Austropuccinia psidii MF-1]
MESTDPTSSQQAVPSALNLEQVLLSIMKNQDSISSTIGILREDVDKLKISPPAPTNTSQTSQKKKKDTSPLQRAQSEPPASKVALQKYPSPYSSKLKSSPKNTPPSSKTPVKCNPLQLQSIDFPPEFKGVKDAFYKHLKILWDITEKDAVPSAPSQETLVQFYRKFSNSKELQSAVQDSCNIPLLENENDVRALAARQLKSVKLAQGISRIGASYQSYIQGALARLGFTIWSPNLAQDSEDLYNVACRILAITTFQQIAAAGAFNNQNVNLAFIMKTGLMQKAYNHFVHYFMKARYEKEAKAGGSIKAAGIKNSTNKSRERLRNARRDFAILQKFPNRYRQVIEDIRAHSDDECHPTKDVYIIKKLTYRSKKANIFFRKLDEAMLQYHKNMGMVSRFRTRVLPKEPVASSFTAPPIQLPIDFYNIKWFKHLSQLEKKKIVNMSSVAFLPDPEDSLKAKRHPDEKCSDRAFNKKYYDEVVGPYELQEDEESVDEEEDRNRSDDGSINLEAPSEGEESEADDGLYAPGEYNYEDDEFSEEGESGAESENEEEPEKFNEETQDAMEGLEEEI